MSLITIIGRGHGGTRNYGSAFLPAAYQGTAIGTAGVPASRAMIEHMTAADGNVASQREQLDFLQSLNRRHWERADHDEQLEGVIDSYELAFRMQMTVPEATNIEEEPAYIHEMYRTEPGQRSGCPEVAGHDDERHPHVHPTAAGRRQASFSQHPQEQIEDRGVGLFDFVQ